MSSVGKYGSSTMEQTSIACVSLPEPRINEHESMLFSQWQRLQVTRCF